MLNPANCLDDSMITLPAVLDLTAAEPLQRTLLDRGRTGDALIVVGAAVERVSTAAIQVLLAAAAEGRLRGVSFCLRDPSAVLSDALADLGVATCLSYQTIV
jgi:chemotaxis protein CheX